MTAPAKPDLMASRIVERMDALSDLIRTYAAARKVSRETAITLLQLALLDEISDGLDRLDEISFLVHSTNAAVGTIEFDVGTIADNQAAQM